MESSGKCIPHKSKKRVIPGSSSGTDLKRLASSSPSNRTLKGKNKIQKPNEDVIVSVIELDSDSEDHVSDFYNGKVFIDLSSDDNDSEDDSPTLQAGMESSNPQIPESSNKTLATGTTHSTQSIVGHSANRKHKGAKSSFHPEKGTKTSPGSSSSTSPSLRLQKGAMKVKSVKKPVKTRSHKMSTRSSQITPMKDVKLEEDSRKIQASSNVAGTSSNVGQQENKEVLRKYPNFKMFDIVEDYSDHHYKGANSEKMQPQRNWAKNIEKEWRILEKDLPDTILVRVYESRMDLLRAVIIGAEGTPYHDGLFFFDIYFPNNYPNVPLINPNLYEEGKVCLSLLNTWSGNKNEKWTPGVSTMLQVLVSIQGLILNEKPYFNEPEYADSSGSSYGESQSMLYSERTLIYSLKTMVYTMKNPPKHFKDLVIMHFLDRALPILTICKGYTNGVGIDGVDKKGSNGFGKNVERYMGTLVGALKEIGAENVDEFVPKTRNLAQKIRAFFGI